MVSGPWIEYHSEKSVKMFLDIAVIERDPLTTAVFRKKPAHHALRKEPIIHVPSIFPEVPSRFGQQVPPPSLRKGHP